MLPKKNRADKKAVERIFKACPPNGRGGRFFNFPDLTFKFILDTSGKTPRISVIVPKSIAKKAVNRNSLRRRTYTILDKYIHEFPISLIAVLVFKKYQEDISIIENEIKNFLDKIN